MPLRATSLRPLYLPMLSVVAETQMRITFFSKMTRIWEYHWTQLRRIAATHDAYHEIVPT